MALPARYKNPRFLIQLALIVPVLVGTPYALHALNSLPHRPHTGLSQGTALYTVFLGLLILISAFNRRVALMPVRPTLFGAAGTIVCGLSLFLPSLAPVSWNNQAVFLAFAAMTVVSMLLHRPYWRAADEMLRQVSINTERLSMRIFFFAVLIYAAAQSLGLNTYFSLWNFVAQLLLLQSVVRLWGSIRHYGLTPPDDDSAEAAPA